LHLRQYQAAERCQKQAARWAETSHASFRQISGPTLLVAATIYGGWIALTWWFHALPWWSVLVLGGWIVCWQGSLQHEIVHGHPTRIGWLNTALAIAPLSLWMPYAIYKESHLHHHHTADLTVPGRDPESYYVDSDSWDRTGAFGRALLTFNNTLFGRMTIGPIITVVRLWSDEGRQALAGQRDHLWIWVGHAFLITVLSSWVIVVCQIPWWQYVLLFAWPGLSMTLLRSYTEHRPATEFDHRMLIVDSAPPMRLLYLNNNLHALHHSQPNMPWYELPAAYEANRKHILQRNGGFRFSGYVEIARRYLFSAKDSPLFPETASLASRISAD
jgi:fatty acid desaturase